MNPITIMIWIACCIACTIIHNKKGYSPFTGFLWGFFFTIIGLIVVLLEKDKEQHDIETSNNNGLQMWQWLLIFLGIGIAAIIILFVCILK